MLERCLQWEKDLGCDPEDCELSEGGDEEDGRMLQVLKGLLFSLFLTLSLFLA